VGATTLLSVWAIGGPTIIRWNHGSPAFYTTLTIGSVLPVTTSSAGRVFLAFLPESLLAPRLVAEGYKMPPGQEPPCSLRNAKARPICVSMAAVEKHGSRGHSGVSQRQCWVPHDAIVATITVIASDIVPRSADEEHRKGLLAACAKATTDIGGGLAGTAPVGAVGLSAVGGHSVPEGSTGLLPELMTSCVFHYTHPAGSLAKSDGLFFVANTSGLSE